MKKSSFFAVFLFAAVLSMNFHNIVFAVEPTVKAPESLDEAKKAGEKTFELAKNDLPGIIKNIWRNEVWPVWRKMGESMKNFWHTYLKSSWEKFKKIFQKEIDERKPIIGEEFQKEKEELKNEAPAVGKSLWQKLKEIFQ